MPGVTDVSALSSLHTLFGKKEGDILNDNNPGNCSVCWNLMKTPYDLKDKAKRLIEGYISEFRVPANHLTYELLDLETTYYRWIYTSQFDHTKRSIKKRKIYF